MSPKSFRRAVWSVVVALGLALAGPVTVSAAVLTYYPSGTEGGDNDLDDLTHQNAYTWRIDGIPTIPAGQVITTAYVTFKNLYNWNTAANVLYMNLLDTAKLDGGSSVGGGNGDAIAGAGVDAYTSTVRYTEDNPNDNVFDDRFDATPDTSEVDPNDPLTATGTNKTNLTDHSFLGEFQAPNNAAHLSSLATTLTNAGLPAAYANGFLAGPFNKLTPGWSFSEQTGANAGKFDYTYVFTAGQLTALTSYINGTGAAGTPENSQGTIALAFDPDCHFFNEGASFTFEYGNGTITPLTTVPEPASLLLLGSGLVMAGSYHRKRMKKKLDKAAEVRAD